MFELPQQQRGVEICRYCDGAGRTPMIDENKHPVIGSDMQPIIEVCPICKGEGRLLFIKDYYVIGGSSPEIEKEPEVREISLKNLFKKRN